MQKNSSPVIANLLHQTSGKHGQHRQSDRTQHAVQLRVNLATQAKNYNTDSTFTKAYSTTRNTLVVILPQQDICYCVVEDEAEDIVEMELIWKWLHLCSV